MNSVFPWSLSETYGKVWTCSVSRRACGRLVLPPSQDLRLPPLLPLPQAVLSARCSLRGALCLSVSASLFSAFMEPCLPAILFRSLLILPGWPVHLTLNSLSKHHERHTFLLLWGMDFRGGRGSPPLAGSLSVSSCVYIYWIRSVKAEYKGLHLNFKKFLNPQHSAGILHRQIINAVRAASPLPVRLLGIWNFSFLITFAFWLNFVHSHFSLVWIITLKLRWDIYECKTCRWV